jgi:hypothetical protein
MKALLLPALACFLVAASSAMAQTQPAAPGTASKEKTTDRESDSPQRFWQANLPGGSYMVALDRITAVSRHSYAIIEAGMMVDEVVVDTVGQSLVRFYFVRPLTEGINNAAVNNLTERAKELIDYGGQRAGTDVHKMVTKKYPEGNYARTVEYRLLSAEELGALYGSVRTAWEKGRGRTFTVK